MYLQDSNKRYGYASVPRLPIPLFIVLCAMLKADAARRRLQSYYGDHETLITIYNRFVDMSVVVVSCCRICLKLLLMCRSVVLLLHRKHNAAWCKEYFVNRRTLVKVCLLAGLLCAVSIACSLRMM